MICAAEAPDQVPRLATRRSHRRRVPVRSTAAAAGYGLTHQWLWVGDARHPTSPDLEATA
jgi:hypothetical protein